MTVMSRSINAYILLLGMGVLGMAPLQAQRVPGGGRGQDRARLEQRVRARFAETMQLRLGLTEEQGKQLAAVMNEMQGDRRELGRDEQALRQRVEAIFADDEATDEEAREVLRRMEELRLREARLFQVEQERLLEVLSPVQLVRFHAMREQLAARVRQLRGGPPGPGRRPGGSDDMDGPFPPGL